MAKYEIDMTRGSAFKKIILFSVPLMLTGLLQLFYNAADVVVVGRFAGKEALAAVGSTHSLSHLMITLFTGLSVGTSVTVSKYFGAADKENMHKAVHTSVAVSILSGIFLAFFGWFAARTLLTWMGSPADVIDGATLYVQIYFLGMPFNMVYNFGAAILRAVGDTRRPLFYLSIAGVVNVLLNLLFVIVFEMSVAGVALATIISQAVSMVLVLRCLLKSSEAVRLDPKKLRIDGKILGELCKVGLPAGIQGGMFSLSNVLIQTSINSFGSDLIAGNSAALNLESFIYCAMNTFHQSAVTFASQNRGAKQYKRIRKGMYVCMLCVTVTGVFGGNLMYLFRDALLGLYNSDPNVIAMGAVRMLYIMPLYLLCGIQDMMSGHIRGMGYSLMPTIVALLGICVFRVVWIYTVFAAFPTPDVLYASYPVTWLITSIAYLICYAVVIRKFPKEDEPLPEAV